MQTRKAKSMKRTASKLIRMAYDLEATAERLRRSGRDLEANGVKAVSSQLGNIGRR